MRLTRPFRGTCLAAGCALALLAIGLAPGGRSGPATADAQGQAPGAQGPGSAANSVTLTDALIDRFLVAQTANRAIIRQWTAKMQALAADGQRPTEAAILAIEAEKRKLIREAVAAAGFADMEDYGRVTMTLTKAFHRFDPATGAYDDPEAALAKRIAEIEADATMPAAARTEVIASLRKTLEVHRGMGVTPANVEAVRRNFARIKPVLGF